MSGTIRTVTIGVVVIALTGAILLASIRDGQMERVMLWAGTVMASLAALLSGAEARKAADKVDSTEQSVQAVATDVATVKHQTNGALAAHVQQAVAAAVAEHVPAAMRAAIQELPEVAVVESEATAGAPAADPWQKPS